MAEQPPEGNRDGEIAKLAIRHQVQPKMIAASLKMDEAEVRSSLKRIHRGWLKRIDQSFDRLIAQEVARLDEVEKAAWEGWDRSLRDEVSQTSKDVSGSDSDKHEATIKRTSKAGTPAFLSTISSTIKQRCELLGLVDPEARNTARNSDDSQVVPIVIESREQADGLKTLSLDEFRKASRESPGGQPGTAG